MQNFERLKEFSAETKLLLGIDNKIKIKIKRRQYAKADYCQKQKSRPKNYRSCYITNRELQHGRKAYHFGLL